MPEQASYRILLLIKSLGLGGAERLLVDALPYLDRERFEYQLAYMLPWKDFLVPDFERAGVPVYCLGSADGGRRAASPNSQPVRGGGWRAVGVLPRAWWALERLARQEQFDLIHADLPAAGLLARLVGRRHGAPVIYTEHGLQEWHRPLTRWVNGLTYGWNRHVLAVSAEVSASIKRAGLAEKTGVTTLLNGIPVEQVRAEATDLDSLRRELDIPEGHLVVGTVAVFRRQKRLEDWLQVAGRLAANRTDVTFLLVGDGPEAARVRSQVEHLNLERRVRLPGFRADGRRLLGLMDVYLMSSTFEGLPIALLEAMALGKPVVTTAVGGIPEVIQDGVEGWLTPVGAVEALAGHTLTLLQHPLLRQEMGRRGALKVEQEFHVKKRVQSIERLYLEVLAREHHRVIS